VCFGKVFCCFNKFVYHGGRRGNTLQALAQWWHPMASSEALNVLHLAMHPTLYCCIAMAYEIASDVPAFLLPLISLLPTSVAK